MRRTRQQIANEKAKWDRDVTAQLQNLLDQLLAAPNDAAEPPLTKGVYLFSERGDHKYVGRAGRSFLDRYKRHVRPDISGVGFKYWLMVQASCQARNRRLPRKFWTSPSVRKEHPWKKYRERASFCGEVERQCQRIRMMTFRVVEINDPKLATVFEVYASTILGTMNSWETH
jgi:hypothetical protein